MPGLWTPQLLRKGGHYLMEALLAAGFKHQNQIHQHEAVTILQINKVIGATTLDGIKINKEQMMAISTTESHDTDGRVQWTGLYTVAHTSLHRPDPQSQFFIQLDPITPPRLPHIYPTLPKTPLLV